MIQNRPVRVWIECNIMLLSYLHFLVSKKVHMYRIKQDCTRLYPLGGRILTLLQILPSPGSTFGISVCPSDELYTGMWCAKMKQQK